MDLKYFKIEDFDCPNEPGSGTLMDPDFLQLLDRAREISGTPFIINSGVRTPERNAAVGGRANSAHLSTREGGPCAVDIAVKGSRDRFLILKGLIEAGCHRIGIARTFIHADGAKDLDPEVTWLYK